MTNEVERIILGIDPGTLSMGYGIISIKNQKVSTICLGEVRLNKLENQQLKLLKIYEKVKAIILEYKPDECAIESPFYGENVQSMLKLGRAQGVAMVASLSLDIPIVEYSPRKIKLSITGNGNASKEQVANMLKSLCSLKSLPKSRDATDGLAVAMCHYFQNTHNTPQSKQYKDWSSFVNDNKNRIKK